MCIGGGGWQQFDEQKPTVSFSPSSSYYYFGTSCMPVPLLFVLLQRPKLYKKRLQSTLANTKKLLKVGSKGRLLPGRPFCSGMDNK